MRIAYITAGAAGMYCGSCLHDNTLAAALQRQGHEVALIPTYTPVRTDEHDVSIDRVFYGALNVYLEQKWRFFEHSPRLLHWLLDRRPVLNWISRFAGSSATQGATLGALTLSMLQGENGHQHDELERLVSWLSDEYQPQLVHITNSMLLGMARRIKSRLGVPVVCSLQGEDLFLDEIVEPYRTQVHDEIRRRAADVDAFIAPSRYYAGVMGKYLGVEPERLRIARLGITVHGHEESRRTPEQAFTIGYLARLCPEKGLDLLLDAFRQLTVRYPDEPVRLRIAGYLSQRDEPWLQGLRNQVVDWGLADSVEWLGEVDRDGKMRLLGGLDVFCVPTVYQESKGLPVLEAMASGVAVVQPAHGAFPEIIDATGGGILVQPHSAEALANGLADLMHDPERRARLATRGRTAVHASFTDDAMAEETLTVYREWIDGDATSSAAQDS